MAVTSIDDTDASTPLLAPNSNLKGASFYNASTAILYLLQGTGTASASNYSVQLPANAYWESPHENWVRGGVTGIWASDASGSVKVTTW